MEIAEIKNEDLVYFGERIEPYFASSIIIRGMVDKKNLAEVLEWENGVRWIYTNNYFFTKKDDLMTAKSTLSKKFKENGVTYTKNLIDKCFEFGNSLLETAKEIEAQAQESDLDKARMLVLLKKYLVAGSNYMIFQNIGLFEDSVAELAHETVQKYAKDEEEAQALLSIITTPNRLTGGEMEQDDFLRLCVTQDKDTLAEQHARKYGWLSIRFFVGEPWQKADVIERMNTIKPNEAEEELAKRIKHRENVEEQVKTAIKDFDQGDKEIVQLIRDIVFLRTQRTDFFQESSYYVQPLVKLIAKELGVTYYDLLYLSGAEVLLALEGKLDYVDCIKRRTIGFLVFFDYDKDRILEGEVVAEYIKDRPILNRDSANVNEIAGNIGYKGKVTGRVKIVKSDKDNSKVEKGDIMVSIMTTPNFIPAMEKAAAFVTDEGGITCHAAIIAREMKKPCIIGTKIATKVLKDGDTVEVDAEKGIVTKIS